ncbi:3-oxoacyl-[acyl-carrier-protein] synthase-3 [Amycolatopsis bartoniae]|uniref:Beta-ketoacyl-[acyl-carrier-protein] synthase III n=1 Tax=Amycolatopsis bartoniae TaxID=941986 RepID=A0A8H9MFP1_9PSEU|nr:beta-ketoacyl-ACP synthase III [Amycolatopsis bartoniae]MBB2934152.1 3-oxoacyl-[acyl-carrier-protein] synthase-3 [Amycolatopsis bartoniae]TVT05524.1 ketoacyl-ACP synthase III [Amycolatopsis bartoniae]GHF88872.1 3-oxoacyl-[acyl-carrier-protein] synthase 3 [Amycolatopsis bartoniae]
MTTLRLKQGPAATRVLGVGSYQPERRVTNDELSKIMETTDQWIRDRVGIIERRFAEKDELLVDMAVTAGHNALADAGVEASEVDTVIVPNCTMPSPIPNAAAQVADRIGVKAAGAFDLNAACAGFCYGLGVASDLIRSGSAGKVLVIGAEKLTDVVDPVDRANAIIFADGAGAAVVGPSDEPGIGPVAWGSAGDLVDTIYMREHRFIYQEGQSVFRWATTQIAPIAFRALELAGLEPSDVDVLIPHQANLRIVEAIAKKLRAKGAREDMLVADDIRYSGNTSSASIPMALDHMRKAGTVKSGDVVLMVGFGAGLSYAGQVVICP